MTDKASPLVRLCRKKINEVSTLDCISNHACSSDAAQEPIVGGSGGFLLLTAAKQRLGSVVHIDQRVMSLWPEHEVVIAQLEPLMILQALQTFS